MNKRFILFILTLYGVCAFAQTPKRYYVKMIDERAKESAVEKICDEYSNPNVTKEAFLNIFKEALTEYMNKSKKNMYTQQDIDSLHSTIKRLKDENNSLNNIISKLRQDSINAEESKINIDVLVRDSINSYKAEKEKITELLNVNKLALEDSISKLKELKNICLNIKEKDKYLKAENNKNQGFDAIAALYIDTKKKIEDFHSICTSADTSLSTIASLSGDIEKVIDTYNTNKSLIPDNVLLSPMVANLEKYKPLALCVNRAIRQMADSVFDNTANQQILKELKGAQSGVTLTPNQKKEFQGIVEALEDQQYAFKNIRATLNDILYYEKIDDTNRKEVLDDCINYNVKAFNGNDYENYSQYYKHFNKILNDVKDNVKTNKGLTNKDKLERYIQKKKDSLKTKE